MKKNYYTPQLRFHKLRFNAAIQAASGEARIGIGGSNYGGDPFERAIALSTMMRTRNIDLKRICKELLFRKFIIAWKLYLIDFLFNMLINSRKSILQVLLGRHIIGWGVTLSIGAY